MKNWFHEIRRGYLGAAGAALLALTLATIPKLPRLVLGLELSDMQVLYIRAGLALFGFAALAFVGWILYFQTRRELGILKRGVFSRLKPVPGKGYQIDTLTGDAVCPRCTTDEHAVPMSDQDSAYYCYSCGGAVKK
jgi:hypothetical protein